MARELLVCPHCRARSTMSACAYHDTTSEEALFLFACTHCAAPIVVKAEYSRPKFKIDDARDVYYADCSFKSCGWQVADVWPKPTARKVQLGKGVPHAVGLLFEHCQEASTKNGSFELCFLGLQRVLKMTQAHVTPGFRGSLTAWITSLIRRGKLTSDLKDWASRLAISKEPEEISALRAEEFSLFVKAVLEQLFGVKQRMSAYGIEGCANL